MDLKVYFLRPVPPDGRSFPIRDDPYRIVAALRDGLAPGSYLAMVHLSGDFVEQDTAAEAVSIYEHASARLRPGSRTEILRFFDGFELVPPGLVPQHEWRPDGGGPGYRTSNVSWSGVGRKNPPSEEACVPVISLQML